MHGDRLADAGLEDLVASAAAGECAAWQQLWRAIEPHLSRLVANPRFLGPIGQREDDRRNVLLEVMARLCDNDFHRLDVYLAARRNNPRLNFLSWLRVVAKRVGIDYLRAHPDYQDGRRGEWVQLAPRTPSSDLAPAGPPVTRRERPLAAKRARQLLRYAAAGIPEFQRRALELWIHDDNYVDIASALALASPAEAERVVRAAITGLRRHLRERGREAQR